MPIEPGNCFGEVPTRHVGHLYFDGSSTALGLGDDSGRCGFVGRTKTHYITYNDLPARDRDPCVAVLLRDDSDTDKHTLQLASHLDKELTQGGATALINDVNLYRALYDSNCRVQRIGVLLLGQYPYAWNRRPDDPLNMKQWGEGLERIESACLSLFDYTFVIGRPRPQSHHRTNLPLFDAIAARTQRHVSRWDDTQYVSFRDILPSQNADEATYMAPDGIHPNAEGHEQIARFLISRIDTILQVPGDIMKR